MCITVCMCMSMFVCVCVSMYVCVCVRVSVAVLRSGLPGTGPPSFVFEPPNL